MRYTPYRGLNRVSNWVRLKFAAMNLKKLAKWKWKPADFLLLFPIYRSILLPESFLYENNPLFAA